jgi:Protein of unknown function (DUF998)
MVTPICSPELSQIVQSASFEIRYRFIGVQDAVPFSEITDDGIDFINSHKIVESSSLGETTFAAAMKALIKTASLAGIIGPTLFAGVLIVLTAVEYDFMRSLGWTALGFATDVWPSGLALGRYGYIMSGAFLLNGILVVLFTIGLSKALPQTKACRLATFLLVLAGIAMAGLTFLTDATSQNASLTWHGRIHDGCFAALGSALFPAMLLFGWVFRKSPSWNRFSTYTWLTAALAVPTFALKGAAFYLFLVAVLTWTIIVARKLADCSYSAASCKALDASQQPS